MNDPKYLIVLTDQRITVPEQKLAATQRELAAAQQHTRSYQAPRCSEFVSVLNLKDAVENPGGHAGMGVYLVHPGAAAASLSQTPPPGK